MGSYTAEEEIQDGSLTYDEACAPVSGLKLQGPENKPMKSDRGVGDVRICDLPIRHLDESSGKVECAICGRASCKEGYNHHWLFRQHLQLVCRR